MTIQPSERDIRRTNPTIDYLFQPMHSESKFHTRRETDPTCLTPAAEYTEGITRPKVLCHAKVTPHSASSIVPCGTDPFRRLRSVDIYPDFLDLRKHRRITSVRHFTKRRGNREKYRNIQKHSCERTGPKPPYRFSMNRHVKIIEFRFL